MGKTRIKNSFPKEWNFLKVERVLNIKGTLLDQYQLENYLEKIASDHILMDYSTKDTYPIARLEENFEVITQVYHLLNEHVKLAIPIHPAGEWILDNYYIIEEAVKGILKELTLKKYRNFLGIANGVYHGFARVYVLAAEIVAYTEATIDAKTLKEFLKSYQRKKTLSMEEIWNIGTFLQIAIIENIREVCEKIYSSQMQKWKAENMLERLVEMKDKEEIRIKNVTAKNRKIINYEDIKYPFIEYLSYRLKRYGKIAYPYLAILEEEVNKAGLSISEAIKKEHYDIAVKKVKIENCIKSIKEISRINFLEIFEEINGVEEILKQDPAGIYSSMDYRTKTDYRNKIKELSKKTRISEIYISEKLLFLARKAKGEIEQKNQKEISFLRKTHIGYYLIDEGEEELVALLQNRVPKKKAKAKDKLYVFTLFFITLIFTLLLGLWMQNQSNHIVFSIFMMILLFIPLSEIVKQIMQTILNKVVKPKRIPKMDYQNGIEAKDATFVVIPTIVKDRKKVKEMLDRLEVFYLANQSNHLYFALLGDCSSGKNETEPFDYEIEMTGKEIVKKLNEKYPDETMPKFHFIYRKRLWNKKEKCYLGWERKRGLLNQFNEYLLGNIKNPFKVNTLEEVKEKKSLPAISYVITLDADTDLTLGSGLELIGTMSHILNKPVLDEKKNIVIKGHALIQPRVGIDLIASNKSIFSKIYAGSGGTDSYTNAISDTYQDNFGEGIFTGKGIYDLKVFSKILADEIPDNLVLSHDLLEGCYLRCGLASDILLMDGFPSKYTSYMTRLSRWMRGDWQIIQWLGGKIKDKKGQKKANPLGFLCRYKILDNLFRSLNKVVSLIGLILLCIFSVMSNAKVWLVVTAFILSLIIPTIVDLFNRIIFRKEAEEKQKNFAKTVPSTWASIVRGAITLATLPYKVYLSFTAIVKTIYRLTISKENLLEWLTAEEAEKQAKTDLKSYYTLMLPNVVLGILGIAFFTCYYFKPISILVLILSISWLIAPAILCKISKDNKLVKEKLSHLDEQYLLEIGQKTWKYFEDYLTQEYHFLPPDNYQEDRRNKIVPRTSSTNIGLALLSVLSAYDLKYIEEEKAFFLLENMLLTIEKLQKWNGHLYNWYDIKTLEPLMPRYISTVDSGNFISYLYALKSFLKKKIEDCDQDEPQMQKLKLMLDIVTRTIQNTDFSKLYDFEKRIFSIGYNIEENKLTDSYYDLLASEARTASLVAIAKKDIPYKHWYNLSRTLTVMNQYKGLVSWSGTSFEYLMPNVVIPKYIGSLLDESCQFMIMSQKEYCKRLGIPWGISEAAFNLKDLNNNYQYKAFGIPWLGLKRGLGDDMVVSSYGSILALTEQPKNVVENIRKLDKQGMYQKYGFYESIDYTASRLRKSHTYELVKTYMAHHQALILLTINNYFNQNILQTRFMDNPELQGTQILLQERMPENVIITKEKKEKIEKLKYADYENYTQRCYHKVENRLQHGNVIANGEYTIVWDDKGCGYSKYKNILINRYKKTDDIQQGIFFYFKNIKSKRIWTASYMNYLGKADKYDICFAEDKNKITRMDGNIETVEEVTIGANEPVEIRKIELTNYGNLEETIEITSVLEPVLSTMQQDYAHPAFNNLFLTLEYDQETQNILVKRKARLENESDIYLAVNLYTENETIGENEFEFSKEKLIGRNNIELPEAILNSKPLSKKIGLVTDPIIATKKTIRIEPKQKVTLSLILSVSEEREIALENLEKYKNNENLKHTFELARARVEAENRYLGLKGEQIETYQKLLSYLIFDNPLRKKRIEQLPKKIYKQSDLWKYGISGDLPILLIKIKDVNDIEIVQEILKAYELYRIKNIFMDLIILDEEKYSYEKYVKEEIESTILNRHIAYLKNQPSGIFVLEADEIEDKNLLEFKANVVIDAHIGSLKLELKELEENYIDTIKNIGFEAENMGNLQEESYGKNSLEEESLKYYNEYGGFSPDGKEYRIRVNKQNRLPAVWSMILANPHFGTVVTETMGGYTFSENSRLNRITAWSNNVTTDLPSEVIYLQDSENKNIWSLGAMPAPDNQDYYVTYGFGYSHYEHSSNGIDQEYTIFVPREDNLKVGILKLKNTLPRRKKLKLVYYIKPVLDEDELKSTGAINISFQENSNLILAKNQSNEIMEEELLYVSSSEKIKSYTGSKKGFFGNGNLKIPDGIKKVALDEENSLGEQAIIAVEIEVELESYEAKEISLYFGTANHLLEAQDICYQYAKVSKCKEELEKVKKYWEGLIQNLQVKTPVESTNIILNGWLVYQTISSRLWAKTGFYQSGGAIGFRDQLQDTLGLKYISTDFMKNQIIEASKHQFLEGDVEHWWHKENQRGVRTRFSDDLLWLAYVTYEYINFTGDEEILKIEVPYLKGEVLEEGQDERYDRYEYSQIKEDIYHHILRAVEKSLDFGENGLPKIGSGDWNDSFSKVGNKGKGESVWLGFFLYDVLGKTIEMIRIMEEEKQEQEQKIAKYEEIRQKLRKALNQAGWDGRWYRRAFTDDGKMLGSMQNEECRIDGISQSWSVISDAGDNDKKFISMESLENHLVDKENGLIKLLDPPFEKGNIEPGYIKAYLPGVRENGGQYTHAAVWSIIAEAKLGFGDKAAEFFRMINPIEHARTKNAATKYKVEPYVVAADVYGQKNLVGMGGWTWYTGSSSWLYKAGIESILGLKIERQILKIEPCIPTNWEEYEMHYRYKNSIYHIKVKNPNRKNIGVDKFIVNKQEVEDKQIKLEGSGGIYEIEVIM